MTEAQAGRASYRWLTITLLVAGGAYAWYASGQYGRLNDLNQRQLSNASAELKTAIDTAVETVTRFNRKRADVEEQGTGAAPEICDFDHNQPYLDLPACATDGSPIPRGTKLEWRTVTVVQPFTSPTLGIKVASTDGKVDLPFRFRADKVLRELAFPDSFGLIFIASNEGEILYQDAPGRRRWLRHLRWGEQTFRDANADRPPTLQIQNLQELVGTDAERWKQLRSVSSRTRVEIGGTAHQLYLQPLVLEQDRQRVALVVGGAVPTTTIVRDAMALDTYLVAFLVFLLLLAVSGFPFVKLWVLSPNERFRLRDVIWLYLSTGALLVLMTCGVLALDGYNRWQAAADSGLEGLARNLESRFLAEVSALRDEVEEYDAKVRLLPVLECDQWHAQPGWFARDPRPAETPAALLPAPDLSIRAWPRRDVHIRQLAWIQSDGWQIWKLTADTIPGRTQVDQRVYFRAVQEGSLFQTPDSDAAFYFGADRSVSDGKFYTFFSMRSSVSPPRCDGSSVADNFVVVAASGHLLSLDRQPLPAGYGFALINREGRVLYHSDGRLSLRENLYEELSEGGQARAMVYAGRDGMVKTGYRERPHRFHLHPVALLRAGEPTAAGFYLAVFREASVERALIGHVFVSGLIGPMLVLLVIYAAGLGILSYASGRKDRDSNASAGEKRHWSEWLWPHGGLKTVYKRQAVAFASLLLLAASLYVSLESALVFLATPIVAVLIGFVIYRRGTRSPVDREPLSTPVWHSAAILLALACMIVTPSSVLFRLALSHEFAKLILTEREWIEAQKSDTLRATAVETRSDNYAPARVAQLRGARQRQFGCVPAPFDVPLGGPESPQFRQPAVLRAVQRGTAPAPPTPAADTARSNEECVPVASDSGAPGANRPVGLKSIGMDAWLIDALHPLDDVLPVQNEILARQHFKQREFAYSPDGTMFRPLHLSALALASLVIILLVLRWWIRWNANRLFLADQASWSDKRPDEARSDTDKPDPAWPTDVEDQIVLLQVARDRIANPKQARVHRLLAVGALQLTPGLRPSEQFDNAFLEAKRQELQASIEKWEKVTDVHSWRYARLILISSVAALGLFLIVTQPGLQSTLVGIATGLTGALTAGLKLREVLASWFPGRNRDA